MLDDDSGKLGEITELFTDVTLPIRVEKLLDVRSTQCFFRDRGGKPIFLEIEGGVGYS